LEQWPGLANYGGIIFVLKSTRLGKRLSAAYKKQQQPIPNIINPKPKIIV